MSKKGVIIGIVVAAAIAGGVYTWKCVEKVDAGNVGVVYSVKGGVQDNTLSEGWHFLSPFEHVKEFTIGNEQIVLSKDEKEGSEKDDSFKVTTSDNANIAISFQMSYRYIADKVPETYKSFRGMDGEDIINKRVKSVLKSKISEVTTNYSLMDIYSGDRAKINSEITDYLAQEFEKEYGIEVIDASIVDTHPDENLSKTIDARVTATQEKEKAKAEQEKIKVEQETKLIQAQSEVQIAKEKAEGEASVKKIQADAQADYNKKLAESITPELIQYKETEARAKHGWVTVQGADAVITENK